MGAEAVIARRRKEREGLLDRARGYAAGLPADLDVMAVVVVGSVARGDFNLWSDIDVVVITEHLPPGLLDRLAVLGRRPGGVQPIPWTVAEWRAQLTNGNPLAVEAINRGVWLQGRPADLS